MDDHIKDLHMLPRVEDSLSFLYLEHARIEKEAAAVASYDQFGVTPIPVAALSALLLGPGTTISHAAIRAAADCGCLVCWCGEQGVRTYAIGLGETRSSARLLHQAALASKMEDRLEVVMRMYRMRFPEPLPESLTLQQIRGREGIRVREAYVGAAKKYGVEWSGRSYQRSSWGKTDRINRALSCANSCLYGICHAAIVAAGYSPAIGFIHTGKMLSFVYDVADLYKAAVSIPTAFEAVSTCGGDLEANVRKSCRDHFQQAKLLERILPDIQLVLFGLSEKGLENQVDPFADDEARPARLWNPDGMNEDISQAPGGNWADTVIPNNETKEEKIS